MTVDTFRLPLCIAKIGIPFFSMHTGSIVSHLSYTYNTDINHTQRKSLPNFYSHCTEWESLTLNVTSLKTTNRNRQQFQIFHRILWQYHQLDHQILSNNQREYQNPTNSKLSTPNNIFILSPSSKLWQKFHLWLWKWLEKLALSATNIGQYQEAVQVSDWILEIQWQQPRVNKGTSYIHAGGM